VPAGLVKSSELRWSVGRRSDDAQLRHAMAWRTSIGANDSFLFDFFSNNHVALVEVLIVSDLPKCSLACCFVRDVTRSWRFQWVHVGCILLIDRQ
jgi:hypothetical protein